VKGINLVGEDEVIGMVVADPEGFMLTVCEKGFGKRTPFGANIAGTEGGEETEAEPVEEAPVEEPAEEAAGDEEAARESSAMHYRKQRRGGKGVRDIRTSERNGPVVGVASVRDGDDIMVITAAGMVNRTHVHEIRTVGRNTQGVRIMNLNDSDRIASIAKVVKEAEEEAPTSIESPTPEAP
jgi:DNA gyrase subunit A